MGNNASCVNVFKGKWKRQKLSKAQKEVNLSEGAGKRVQEVRARLSAKLPSHIETKPQKAAWPDTASDKNKCKQKWKKTEVASEEIIEDSPAETRETKNEGSPASDEAREKEATSSN